MESNSLKVAERQHLLRKRRRSTNMPRWPRYPTIYEINTWVWLADLSQKYRNLEST